MGVFPSASLSASSQRRPRPPCRPAQLSPQVPSDPQQCFLPDHPPPTGFFGTISPSSSGAGGGSENFTAIDCIWPLLPLSPILGHLQAIFANLWPFFVVLNFKEKEGKTVANGGGKREQRRAKWLKALNNSKATESGQRS